MPVRALLVRSALVLLVLARCRRRRRRRGVPGACPGCVAVVLAGVVGRLRGRRDRPGQRRPTTRQAAVDAAWRAGVGTSRCCCCSAGARSLAGGAVTALLAGVALGAVLVRWALRSVRAGRAAQRATVVPLGGTAGAPVRALSVEALGREWLRSSAALARPAGPLARQALVERRQEALDELERRDPAGFARWLAEGPTVDSDPARYIVGDPRRGVPTPPEVLTAGQPRDHGADVGGAGSSRAAAAASIVSSTAASSRSESPAERSASWISRASLAAPVSPKLTGKSPAIIARP